LNTNPRPPQVEFCELAGQWTISIKLGVDGVLRASIGRLDMDTRKVRWTPVGEHRPQSVPARSSLYAFIEATELAVLAASEVLGLT